MARRRGARDRLRRGADDQKLWQQAVVVITALMLVVLAWRWYQESKPPEERLGVRQINVERTAGELIIPFDIAPELTGDGGVLSVKTKGLELFVIRLNAGAYRVYETTSRAGRPIKYDAVSKYFIDRRNPKVYFDAATGNAPDEKVDDALRILTVTATGIGLQITL